VVAHNYLAEAGFVGDTTMALRNNGAKYKDIAVLYRKNLQVIGLKWGNW
jgi:superfamily I DNA/RNA helicase